MAVPTPAIYLRDKFAIKPGKNEEFLTGKKNLLANTKGQWKLIAGCGSQSLIGGQKLPEPAPPMMHVWQMEGWGSAYESMYAFTESRWYRKLEDSLLRESQDFLVGITTAFGTHARPAWTHHHDPGHVYLYEEVLLKGTTLAYLRDLNWFTANVAARKWSCVWVARQVTAQPSTICVLWSAPSSDEVARTLHTFANEKKYADRYARMMGGIDTLARQVLSPIYTEVLDQEIGGPPVGAPLHHAV
jgi:hypothetical protein